MAKPMPTARGRCDAIVEVVGMISSSALPNTLCRPPAIGSLADIAGIVAGTAGTNVINHDAPAEAVPGS